MRAELRAYRRSGGCNAPNGFQSQGPGHSSQVRSKAPLKLKMCWKFSGKFAGIHAEHDISEYFHSVDVLMINQLTNVSLILHKFLSKDAHQAFNAACVV